MTSKTALLYTALTVIAITTPLLLSRKDITLTPPTATAQKASKASLQDELIIDLAKPQVQDRSQKTTEDKDMAELEKISAELLAYKDRVGDDPTKMTSKELEHQVTLMEAYNRQFKIVIQNAERDL